MVRAADIRGTVRGDGGAVYADFPEQNEGGVSCLRFSFGENFTKSHTGAVGFLSKTQKGKIGVDIGL